MPLALAICGFVFGLLGLIISAGTLIYVLARRFSTHEVRYQAPADLETRYEFDLPLKRHDDGVVTYERPPPVSLSQEEVEKRERLAQMEAAFDERVADLDF